MLAPFFAALILIQSTGGDNRTVTVSSSTPVTALAPGSLPEQPREGERLICRTESVVGSNRRKRICMTAAQRDAMREQSRDLREGMDRLAAPPLPTPSGGG